MSRDIQDTYERAAAAATDCGYAPGRGLKAIAEGFALKDDAFGLLAQNALARRIGLVKTDIVIDGAFFDIECLLQRRAHGVAAWVMPVYSVPAFASNEAGLVDLIAFADDGVHAGKSWRLVGACDAIGLPFETAQRVLTVYTQPKNWLAHWLKACAADVKWLDAEETGPEAFAALVLDAKKIRWQPYRVEPLSTAQFEEIRFGDLPALRDAVLKEMQLELPRLPRLRAIKAKPDEEGEHGPSSAVA